MPFIPTQSLSTPLIAIAYDTYAAATQAPRNDFDDADRRAVGAGTAHTYLVFTGVGDPERVYGAQELHQGFLGMATEGQTLSEENRSRLFQTKACFPLSVSKDQGHRVKMLASMVETDSPEALKRMFGGNVEVMESVTELRTACDQLQVHQRAGLLSAGGLGMAKGAGL